MMKRAAALLTAVEAAEATAAKQANAADNGLDAKLDALFDGYAPPPDLDLDF